MLSITDAVTVALMTFGAINLLGGPRGDPRQPPHEFKRRFRS